MSEKLGKMMLKNTVTNYVVLGMKMLTAILVTRIIYLGLGEQYYGYWSLLWTIFGYSLLLDFGFGKTVQKYTAEAQATGDFERYSKIITTVIGSYLLMALILVAVTFCTMFFIEDLFSLKTGEPGYYRLVFMIFGIGIAVVFPTGVFPEILVGLKRLDIRNYTLIFNILCELTGIYLIFKLGGSLLALAIFSAVINLVTNFIMAFFVFHFIPKLRIIPGHFSFKNFRHIADFSFFAYLVTMANMVIFKTDRMVLGIMVGMTGVAIYQLGTRLSDILQFLTTQFQENLSPVAASLYKAGDMDTLKEVMLSSVRITAFLSTCAFVIFYLMARPILYVWLKVTDPEPMQVADIMMVSVYIMVVFRSSPNHFLLMSGHHRLIAIVAIIESIVNLGLSIFLVRKMGVIGVAIGTLVPNTIMSLFVILPAAARYGKLSIMRYIFHAYLPVILLAIPPAAFLWWINHTIKFESWTLWKLALVCPAAGLIYLITGIFIYINKKEKGQIARLIPMLPGPVKTWLLR